jgi:hypothetical protein
MVSQYYIARKKMKIDDLTNYWVTKHNEHYFEYLTNYREPRFNFKSFFLYSYYFVKALGKSWDNYLLGYSTLFRRDPSNDYYKKRDPTDATSGRRNSLEWTSAFEIVAEIGFPHNESAKRNFLYYSKMFLEKAKKLSNIKWIDFFLSSAVANLPNEYASIKEWLPSQLEKYVREESPSPHRLMIYLKALGKYEGQDELRSRILSKLVDWIRHPSGTSEQQVLVWARLITRMQWLKELSNGDMKQVLKENFVRSLDAVYGVEWSNSPMILEASYSVADEDRKHTIEKILSTKLTPASFIGLKELFPFLDEKDEALEVEKPVLEVREKCKPSVTADECRSCMNNKKGDCWIRILSKLTGTEPRLHSGYEVADKVIYSSQQGIYIVVKAEEITKQTGEGDVLFRQCCSLFSVDHALVLYLNAFDTAPSVIESIRRAASASRSNPSFEVIDKKYIRQIYKKYLKCEPPEDRI